jgi:phage gp29-like protein
VPTAAAARRVSCRELLQDKRQQKTLPGKGGENLSMYRPQIGQIGSQLDTSLFLFDDCISNIDTVPVEEYERMIDTDETVEIAILFLTMSILLKIGEYQHDDPKITAFVKENFEVMEGNFYSACEEILSALWAGYSGTEIVWRPEGDRIYLQRLVTYHPKTVLIRVDRENGQYKGLKQWRWYDGSPVDIPAAKAILYTYRKRFGNYHGRSILKPVRKNWLLKDPVLKMLAKALDRFGTPITSAVVPDEDIQDPENQDNQISQLTYTLRMLSNLRNGTALAMRYGANGQEPKFNVHSNGGSGIGEAFDGALGYFNKMIARGILAPSLIMDEGKSGSYSLGKSHLQMYNIMTSGIVNNVTEAVLEQLIRPMIEYNFGRQRNYGIFGQRELDEEDSKLLAEVFERLTNSGFLEPQMQSDFDAVRSRMGLPQRQVVTKKDQFVNKVKTEYANYTREGELGYPLAGESGG